MAEQQRKEHATWQILHATSHGTTVRFAPSISGKLPFATQSAQQTARSQRGVTVAGVEDEALGAYIMGTRVRSMQVQTYIEGMPVTIDVTQMTVAAWEAELAVKAPQGIEVTFSVRTETKPATTDNQLAGREPGTHMHTHRSGEIGGRCDGVPGDVVSSEPTSCSMEPNVRAADGTDPKGTPDVPAIAHCQTRGLSRSELAHDHTLTDHDLTRSVFKR